MKRDKVDNFFQDITPQLVRPLKLDFFSLCHLRNISVFFNSRIISSLQIVDSSNTWELHQRVAYTSFTTERRPNARSLNEASHASTVGAAGGEVKGQETTGDSNDLTR